MYLNGNPVEGEVAVITKQQALEADYNLSPSRWAGQSDDASHRDVSHLITELAELDAKATEVNKALYQLLSGVGK
jgi:type I restriction enzyme M protein